MPDMKMMVRRLVENERLSDYDFWRWLKNIDNELYRRESAREPIPFDLVRWRAAVQAARARRRPHLAER